MLFFLMLHLVDFFFSFNCFYFFYFSNFIQIEYNDRPNAELIVQTKKNADLIIRSVDM